MSNVILDFAFNDLFSIHNLSITPNDIAYMAEKKGITLSQDDIIDTVDNVRTEFLNLIERNIEDLIVMTKDIKQGEKYIYNDIKSELLNWHTVLVMEILPHGFYKVKFLTGVGLGREIECKANKLEPLRGN